MTKTDRIGLIAVFASFAAIAAIALLVQRSQITQHTQEIRNQGVSLARVFGGIAYEQLIPGGAQQGLVKVVQQQIAGADFAYVSIVDVGAINVVEFSENGVIAPTFKAPDSPSEWTAESQYVLPNTGQTVIEFRAPLLSSGDLAGFVRLGYLKPTTGITSQQLPLIAAVALPVFLLVPLFYLLLRREIRPVREMSQQMGTMLDSESFGRVSVTATGELGDFMQRFNRFIEYAGERVDQLEHDRKQLVTSTKLITYRKNRVETVLETLPEAVLILDETGAITFANQKVAALFGVSRDVIMSQPVVEWCDNTHVLQLLDKYQSDGRSRVFNETIRFNVDSAARQSIMTKAYPLFSPNNPASTIGTLIIFRDESKEALARQARSDFVSHLSHELKSPLNVLSMYSETMLTDVGKDESFRIEAANVINDEVTRLGQLINGLLSMTQIENGSLTPDRGLIKIREIAEDALNEARQLAREMDLEFSFSAPKAMNPMLADKGLIRIALTNLLSNAVKYNKQGGKVHLSIDETEDAVQIRVADTGIGISESDAGKIFDKFFRAENDATQAVNGHGLGLALTRQIIELHHGSLSVDHEREEGTEFIINLWKESTSVKQAI